MFIGEVNYLAILIAAIVSMALGAFWYSKSGFGKGWMQAIGMSEAQLKESQKGAGKGYAINFVVVLVSAYILSHVVRLAGATTIVDGGMVGFWVWLGFLLPIGLGSMLWESRSSKLTQINAGYQLVQYVLMAAIIAAMA